MKNHNSNNSNSEPGLAEYGIILTLVFIVVILMLLGFFGLVGSAILGIFGIQLGVLPTAVIGVIVFYGGRRLLKSNQSVSSNPDSSRGHVSRSMEDTSSRGHVVASDNS